LNLYSELLDILTLPQGERPAGLFGTLTALSPLTVSIDGTAVSQGLHRMAGMSFCEEDLGSTLALLCCGDGLLILGKAAGV
jgi:hypothetical protein